MDRDDKALRHNSSRCSNKRVVTPGVYRAPRTVVAQIYDNAPSMATTELDNVPRHCNIVGTEALGLPFYESTRMRVHPFPMSVPLFRAAKFTDAGF